MQFKKLKVVFKPAAHAVVLTMALSTQGQAQTVSAPDTLTRFDAEDVAAQRVATARHLHVLSQSIPTVACYSYVGFQPQDSADALADAIAQFDGTLTALENADGNTGFSGSVSDLRRASIIADLRTKFEPLRAALRAVGSRSIDMFSMQVLADHNMDLQSVAQTLVDEVSSDIENPLDRLRPDVMAIEIAARQVVLAQKIAKNNCLVMSKINQTESVEDLRSAIGLFEISLYALQHGMVNVGIPKPPSPAIADDISLVQFKWASLKGLLDIAIDGGTLTRAECKEVLAGLNEIIDDMADVVDLYAAAAKPAS